MTQQASHPTIQDAFDNAVNGDGIEISAGTFFERNITLDNNITVQLSGAGCGQTVIDGQNTAGSIFKLSNGANVNFEGLTIQNGVGDTSPDGGGAVNLSGASTTARFLDCCFEGNDSGGYNGGAVAVLTTSAASFDRCIFRNNTISGYPAGYDATAIYTRAGFSKIINCLFDGEGTNSDSILYFSQAGYTHGVINCTFVNSVYPRSVFAESSGTNIDVLNCVFDSSCYPVNAYLFSTATVYRCLYSYAYSGGDNINGTPTFENAAGGDYRLAAGSLGIDAADYDVYFSAGGEFLDLGRNDRLFDIPCIIDIGSGSFSYLDMGAYETHQADADGDAVLDFCDNCRNISNPGQEDIDESNTISTWIAATNETNTTSAWLFDEGSGVTATDTFGSNDGSIFGAMYVSGQVNTALQFDGIDDFVQVLDDSSLDFGPSETFTVMAWMMVPLQQVEPPNNSDSDVIEKWDGSTGQYPYAIRINNHKDGNTNEGRVSAGRYDGTNNPKVLSSTSVSRLSSEPAQLSQPSPTSSPSLSAWSGFNKLGQLSHASPTPSAFRVAICKTSVLVRSRLKMATSSSDPLKKLIVPPRLPR